MKKCIPDKELDELGEGLVRSYLKKSGIARLPKCVDIEGLANTLGLTIVYEQFREDDFDKIGFLSDEKTPLKVRRGTKSVSFPFRNDCCGLRPSKRKRKWQVPLYDCS